MGLREIIGGFSGFKGRLLLTIGGIVLCGLAWGGARKFLHGENLFSRPFAEWSTQESEFRGASLGNQLSIVLDRASRTLVPVGISFMVAMLAASVLRVAFKTGVAILVIAGMAVWFLDYRGFIDLWGDYLDSVREGGSWLSHQADHVGETLRHQLPSATAALIGFGFGLKR